MHCQSHCSFGVCVQNQSSNPTCGNGCALQTQQCRFNSTTATQPTCDINTPCVTACNASATCLYGQCRPCTVCNQLAGNVDALAAVTVSLSASVHHNAGLNRRHNHRVCRRDYSS